MAAAPPLTPEQQLQAEDKEWDELKCVGKDIAPIDIKGLHIWVQRIAVCLKAVPDDRDKIGIDPYTNGYKLRDYFGPLKDGQLMNADGANNDCLIHSFLTCVCNHFRTCGVEVRRKIARYFRRFIATQIPNINQRDLNSFLPLSTSELKHLCKQYEVPFIVVKGSAYPVDREMEILPEDEEKFWEDKKDSITLPYYIIHGSGVHFTPVSWNQIYEKTRVKYTELKTLRDGILKAQIDDEPINEIRKQKTDKVMNDFLNTDQEIQKIKAEIALLSTQPDKLAYINTNILRITHILHTKINSLQPVMNYRRDYAYANELRYLTLIGGAPAAPLPLPKKEQVFAVEDMDLAAAIEASKRSYEAEQLTPSGDYDATLAKALLNSLETEKQDKAKRVANSITTTSSANSIRLLSSRPTNLKKTVQASAKIGNNPATNYTAYVSDGVFVEQVVRGGKRRTKKTKLSKRKTKRNIKK